jgi:hypothetical protein
MRKNYLETVVGRDWSFRGKRLVGYKHGAPRRCFPPFAWVDQSSWRRSLGRIAEALGVQQYSNLGPIFGPKWGYRVGLMMEILQNQYGHLPQHWPKSAILASCAKTMPVTYDVSIEIEGDDHLAAA